MRLNIVQETTNKIRIIHDRLEGACDRKKSYVDKHRKPLEFQVGGKLLFKMSPWKRILRFAKRGKLIPRYVRPFDIIEMIGPVTYKFKIPEELSAIHNIFHVSNLKKCLAEESLNVHLEGLQINN